MHGHYSYSAIVKEEQRTSKALSNRNRHQQIKEVASNLYITLPSSLQKAMTVAQEKGTSGWLTAFCFHKTSFCDALALRYGRLPPHIPSSYACGKAFSLEHILSCPKGGFPSIRHNKIRDVTITEVCHHFAIEPHLQPLNGENFSCRSFNTEMVQGLILWQVGFEVEG